jgi:hypothetical protein
MPSKTSEAPQKQYSFFCTPVLRPRRHATEHVIIPEWINNPCALSLALLVRAGRICGHANGKPGMLVRWPAHGMQALWAKQIKNHPCPCF